MQVKSAANAQRRSYNRSESLGYKIGSAGVDPDSSEETLSAEALMRLIATLAQQKPH
jgi:hypothetical protein